VYNVGMTMPGLGQYIRLYSYVIPYDVQRLKCTQTEIENQN